LPELLEDRILRFELPSKQFGSGVVFRQSMVEGLLDPDGVCQFGDQTGLSVSRLRAFRGGRRCVAFLEVPPLDFGGRETDGALDKGRLRPRELLLQRRLSGSEIPSLDTQVMLPVGTFDVPMHIGDVAREDLECC
jgi:hypothetical protein